MHLRTDAEFTAWLADGGIVRNVRWKPFCLTFRGAEDCWRYWYPPERSPAGFIGAALHSAEFEGAFWAWRRGGGSWYDGPDTPLSNQILDATARCLGVPNDFEGALGFPPAETRDLLHLLGAYYLWGWGVGEDLYIVPENRWCYLMISHEETIHAGFPTDEARDRFSERMASRGFTEPA